MSAKTISEDLSERKLRSVPSIPWPIPREGFEVEIARSYREPNQTRCGFWWVYTVRIVPNFEEREVLVRAYRVRENIFTQGRSGLTWLCAFGGAVPSRSNAEKIPKSLIVLFEKTIASVREDARRDEELSARGRERAERAERRGEW